MSKSLFPDPFLANADPNMMSRIDVITRAAEVGAEGVYAIECGKPDPTTYFENGQLKFVPFLGIITESKNPQNPFRHFTINTGVSEITLTLEEEKHYFALVKKYLAELKKQADEQLHA